MLKEHYFLFSNDKNGYKNLIDLIVENYTVPLSMVSSQDELYRSVLEKGYFANSLFIVFCEDSHVYSVDRFLSSNINPLNFILICFGKNVSLSALCNSLFDYIHIATIENTFAMHMHRLKNEVTNRHRISLLQNEIMEFYEIGKSLSSEKDTIKLLDMIIQSSINLTAADAGTIYLVVDENTGKWSSIKNGECECKLLKFEIAKNMSMEIQLEASTSHITKESIFGYSVITGRSVRIEDAYHINADFDYKHNSSYDRNTGYKTKSILCIPMKDHENNVVGVIQLINKKKDKQLRINYKDMRCYSSIISFDYTDELIMNSLSGQAAVAIENAQLYEGLQELLSHYKRQNDELSQLSTKVLKAHEEERKRIAREIHDGPAQSVSCLSMKVEVIKKYLQTGYLEHLPSQLDELNTNIRSTVSEIRSIIYDLKPSYLEDGLIKAVQNYLTVIQAKSEMNVFFTKDGQDDKIEYYLTSMIYRVVQEALSNVGKHAKASKVDLTIRITSDCISIQIIDDGKGFDVETLKNKPKTLEGGFGLEGIAERIELVRGTFSLKSELGRGTTLLIKVPIIAFPMP